MDMSSIKHVQNVGIQQWLQVTPRTPQCFVTQVGRCSPFHSVILHVGLATSNGIYVVTYCDSCKAASLSLHGGYWGPPCMVYRSVIPAANVYLSMLL